MQIQNARESALQLAAPTISGEAARARAAEYLIDHMGELLDPGTPLLDNDRWIVPIELSTARTGRLGHVGTIVVDAESGAIVFSAEDREKVKARARSLVGAASP